jgi:hypothetical protein
MPKPPSIHEDTEKSRIVGYLEVDLNGGGAFHVTPPMVES